MLSEDHGTKSSNLDGQHRRTFPCVILLLNQVRRVSLGEAQELVRTVLGDEASATVESIGQNGTGMEYLSWRIRETPYNLGTSSEPYFNVIGQGKVDEEKKLAAPLVLRMWAEALPAEEAHIRAWLSHRAWLYVDALLFHSSSAEEDRQHLCNVLRIAGHLVDGRCLLLWRYGSEPKQLALPTPEVVRALVNGQWLDSTEIPE